MVVVLPVKLNKNKHLNVKCVLTVYLLVQIQFIKFAMVLTQHCSVVFHIVSEGKTTTEGLLCGFFCLFFFLYRKSFDLHIKAVKKFNLDLELEESSSSRAPPGLLSASQLCTFFNLI